ncbi:hypothetical protein [Trinickia dinghuensis]|uniref:Uncharacterized protein n=1 Tax=Trinickia dinghuensis TaxID=2291023 RepID=A0A3D8JTR9_9BURK|nr:hypothetical protein [Trinickia dinghuensis]RDU96115.1 hypothetical protein DWV00_26130 [Trinickia dinghuensis]
MLSPHEISALLLLKDKPIPARRIDENVAALERYRLVTVDTHDNVSVLHLTQRGHAVLTRLLGGPD